MRSLSWAAALCALACATSAAARPYTVDDLLRLESLGTGVIDPSGRWLILERQGRYEAAPRFDADINMRPVHTQLLRIDLARPAAGVPAFPQSPRAGYIAGPFSPSGRFMAVYRNGDHDWEIGIVTVASRQVRWLGFGAEFADRGDTLVWRSDRELLALALLPGDRYYKERLGQAAMRRSPTLWNQAAYGRASTDVAVGSGAFLSVHLPDPVRRLVSIDARSGSARELARGPFQSLALSPSGRRLAVLEAAGRAPLQPDQLISQGTLYKRTRLHLVNLTTGQRTMPCADLEMLGGSLRWSPQIDDLLIVARPTGATWSAVQFKRVSGDGACADLPLGTLKPAIALAGDAATPTAHLDWLGATPIVQARTIETGRSDWFALGGTGAVNLTRGLPAPPAEPAALVDDHALFLVNAKAWSVGPQGDARRLDTPALERVVVPRRPNMSAPLPADGAPRGSTVLAIAAAPRTTALWRLSATDAQPLLEASFKPQDLLAASASRLVARTTDGHGVQTVDVWRDGLRTPVARANAALAHVDFAQAVAIDHLGPEGQPLRSWLYLPAPTADHARPPLLVMAYPSAAFKDSPFFGWPGLFLPVDSNAQLAVAHGYAVLVPSLPSPVGSVDPGKDWEKAILAIVAKVGETQPVDTRRLAYWGHSFGGYVGLMLAARTQRFKAIIASAAPSDLISFRGEGSPGGWLSPEDVEVAQGWAGWSELGVQGHLLATPWTERQRFIENSPVYVADRIHTPILLVQGDQDPVSIGQGREMFSDLYRLNKDALFLTFYGEGHNISSPPNVRALASAAYHFLDIYLQPAGMEAPPPTRSSAAPNPPPPSPAAASRRPQTEPGALR